MPCGISTNLYTTSQAACLKQKGIDFIFRYYNSATTQPQKRLTQAEAWDLSGAGITIGALFFGRRGHKDGSNAFAFAQAVNPTTGSAIHFAVDKSAPANSGCGPQSKATIGHDNQEI
jgi:hypothetical protein